MKKIAVMVLIVVLVAVLSFRLLPRPHHNPILKTLGTMELKSLAFENNENIPAKYTCDGDNINPDLEIRDVPAEAKSLTLIVDDPDAPSGTFVHWVLFNIDPTTKFIDEDSVPDHAIEGETSFAKPGYGGPCPPLGTHHYHFKLYALDTMLELGPEANKLEVEKTMEDHIIAQTELVGLYSK